jgi:hypothetical protein
MNAQLATIIIGFSVGYAVPMIILRLLLRYLRRRTSSTPSAIRLVDTQSWTTLTMQGNETRSRT